MQRALILHGITDKEEYFSTNYPTLSNSHWLPWLQKQLITRNIFAQTPEIPQAYQPNYALWKQEFEAYLTNATNIFIGHSYGGGFLVRWFNEIGRKADKLILVAPWFDPEQKITDEFKQLRIDSSFAEQFNNIHVLISEDDSQDQQLSVQLLREQVPNIMIHKFKNHGHFTYADMGTQEFTELLNLSLGNKV